MGLTSGLMYPLSVVAISAWAALILWPALFVTVGVLIMLATIVAARLPEA